MRIGIVSGGFDPLHVGHVRMITQAAKECSRLIVGANSDEWLTRKKGYVFMPFAERCEVLAGLAGVYQVTGFDDHDNTANALLRRVRSEYMHSEIIFMNGGDRTGTNTPEDAEAKRLNITLWYGIGGHDKAQSSSDLVARWVKP